MKVETWKRKKRVREHSDAVHSELRADIAGGELCDPRRRSNVWQDVLWGDAPTLDGRARLARVGVLVVELAPWCSPFLCMVSEPEFCSQFADRQDDKGRLTLGDSEIKQKNLRKRV